MCGSEDMIKDFSFGTVLYVFVSVVFNREFDVSFYLISLIFFILPDVDFVSYLALKKRFSLVTHRFIHYPLVFVTIGSFVCAVDSYWGALFLLLTLGHFVLDTFSVTEYPTGIQWLYPFSKKSWYISQGNMYQLTLSEQKERLNMRRSDWNLKAEKRTVLWEVAVRLDRLTPVSAISLCIAIASIAFFALGT